MRIDELPTVYADLAERRRDEYTAKHGEPYNAQCGEPYDEQDDEETQELHLAFEWSATPEGSSFWSDVDAAENSDDLPPLPNNTPDLDPYETTMGLDSEPKTGRLRTFAVSGVFSSKKKEDRKYYHLLQEFTGRSTEEVIGKALTEWEYQFENKHLAGMPLVIEIKNKTD